MTTKKNKTNDDTWGEEIVPLRTIKVPTGGVFIGTFRGTEEVKVKGGPRIVHDFDLEDEFVDSEGEILQPPLEVRLWGADVLDRTLQRTAKGTTLRIERLTEGSRSKSAQFKIQPRR